MSRLPMFGSEALQIIVNTNANLGSPAALAGRAKTIGGSHGDDLVGSCAGGFGISVRRGPGQSDRIGTSSVNQVR